MKLLQGFSRQIKKYWPVLVIISIFLLGIYVRTYDYKYPYLRNIDSYTFTRQIEQIADLGYIPNHDNLILAPDGAPRPASRDLYVYSAAYFFNAIKLVAPSYTLFQFLIWFPAFLAALMVIPMYYIGRVLYDRRAGILAAFFIVFDTAIISRTLGADPDNDGSVLLFPLIAMALFLIAYKHINEKGFDKKGIFLTFLAGLGMAAWVFVWTGFWFIIWILGGFVILKILLKYAQTKKVRSILELKNTVILFIAILLICFVVTMPIFGLGDIKNTLQGPFSFLDIKGEENRAFPNVLVSVAELQSGGSIKDVLQRTNVFMFAFMIFSLVYLAYSGLLKKKAHVDTFLLLLIWFVAPLVATTIGVRFSILLAAPLAIGSAIFVSKLFKIIDGEGVSD